MELLPAIDLRGGRCVRLREGRFDAETVYTDDPLAQARAWADAGAQRLHVVDLDGARTGEPVHADVVRRMANALPIPLQLGGGIRTAQTAAAYLEAGVDRIILGTAALTNPALVSELVAAHGGERVAVGIDARDGRVATHGWEEVSSTAAVDLAQAMEARGVDTIIYTDIARDGRCDGPNVGQTGAVADALGRATVIASGGVTTLADVEALCAEAARGISGIIIGKALYDGLLDLGDALRVAAAAA